MSGSQAILAAEQVSLQRPDEDGQMQTVIDSVSMNCAIGEVVAVVGSSGSGKSTLLRLFNRLLEPSSGRILFDGQDIRTMDPPGLRRQVTLVPQKPYLFEGTVQDNLSTVARLHNDPLPDFSQAGHRQLLDLCQVSAGWLDRDGQRLSLGQQQRVCLARALAGESQVLLLDEPTSALDPPTAESLARTFRDLVSEKELALLLVTHDFRVAEQCADRLVVLSDGQIVEEGPAVEVIAAPQSPLTREFMGRSKQSAAKRGEP